MKPEKMRAQTAIEFLLIAAFLLALAAVVLNTVQTQVNDTKALRNAALAKHDLDSLTQSINLVAAQGDGARVTRTLLFPPDVACAFGAAPQNPLSCAVVGAGTVRASESFTGSALFANCTCADCWLDVRIERAPGQTVVACTRV